MMLMAMMMSGATVEFSIHAVTDAAGNLASIEFQSDGEIYEITSAGGSVFLEDWLHPKSAAPGSYEIRATLNSGSLDPSSDATGSWLALTSTRIWTTTASANLTIEIRLGTTVMDSAGMSISI